MKSPDFKSGDAQLSSNDMQLWSLVNEVLRRWGVLVMFKADGIDVPARKRALIRFFVPYDAIARDEIMAFLDQELEDMRSPDMTEGRFAPYPGTEIDVKASVDAFGGLLPYQTIAEQKNFIRQFTGTLLGRMEREAKDKGEEIPAILSEMLKKLREAPKE